MSKYVIDAATLTSLAAMARQMRGTAAALSPAGIAAQMEDIYIGQMYGTDTNSISVHLPWKPDDITIVSFDAAVATAETFMIVSCSFDTVGTFAGIVGIIRENGKYYGGSHAKASFGNFFSYADGVFTYTPPNVTPFNASLWRSEVNYLIFATRSENNG